MHRPLATDGSSRRRFALGAGPADARSRRLARPTSFAAANALYARSSATPRPPRPTRRSLAADPSLGEAHFFLANALDNLYRPGAARASRPTTASSRQRAHALRDRCHPPRPRPSRPSSSSARCSSSRRSTAADKLNRAGPGRAVVKQLIAFDPSDTGSYFGLAKIYEDAGTARRRRSRPGAGPGRRARQDRRLVAVGAVLQPAGRVRSGDGGVRAPDAETRAQATRSTSTRWRSSTRRKSARTSPLRAAQQADYLTKGMEAVDQALALRPDYFEALTYKNLLLRQQARFESDPAGAATCMLRAEARCACNGRRSSVRNAQAGSDGRA